MPLMEECPPIVARQWHLKNARASMGKLDVAIVVMKLSVARRVMVSPFHVCSLSLLFKRFRVSNYG